MKKILFLLAMITCLYSCKSEAERAEEIIREYMFESLYDYESYQPIRTEGSGTHFKHKFRCKTAGGVARIHMWDFTLNLEEKRVSYYIDDSGEIQFP